MPALRVIQDRAMQQFRFYRPLSRTMTMPSGRREQGLAVAVLGLALAGGFGWDLAREAVWSLGKSSAEGRFAGMVEAGPEGTYRRNGVYLFQDASGNAFAATTLSPRSVRTVRPRTEVRPDGTVVRAERDSVAAAVQLSENPFPPTATIAYDPADPVQARVVGLSNSNWPWVLGGLALLALGLWMRRPEKSEAPSDATRDADGPDAAP